MINKLQTTAVLLPKGSLNLLTHSQKHLDTQECSIVVEEPIGVQYVSKLVATAASQKPKRTSH